MMISLQKHVILNQSHHNGTAATAAEEENNENPTILSREDHVFTLQRLPLLAANYTQTKVMTVLLRMSVANSFYLKYSLKDHSFK
mmetsp:Transcript_25334/g.41161  ORF Transcript_25334/g.41161 Transcript_25334/m.41161 type:complete len:85 (-) Transcript_25334:801-1055(-)